MLPCIDIRLGGTKNEEQNLQFFKKFWSRKFECASRKSHHDLSVITICQRTLNWADARQYYWEKACPDSFLEFFSGQVSSLLGTSRGHSILQTQSFPQDERLVIYDLSPETSRACYPNQKIKFIFNVQLKVIIQKQNLRH